MLGGTQSLHTNAYDEALALPTAESAKIALRTQQILAYEAGVADTIDPLAGSYYVEALTAALEDQAREYLDEIARLGGAARAVAYMQDQIHQAAYGHQQEVERGERRIVGVNAFQEAEDVDIPRLPVDYAGLEQEQRRRLAEFRSHRDGRRAAATLEAVRAAAEGKDNLLPPLVEAVKSKATLGEISDALREVWGRYDS